MPSIATLYQHAAEQILAYDDFDTVQGSEEPPFKPLAFNLPSHAGLSKQLM